MKNKICMLITISICIIFLLLILTFLMQLAYPNKYSEYVEKYCNEYDVDTKLVYAIIKQESNFKPDAKSSKGAIGLMQLMKATADELALRVGIEENDLFDPEINIMLGIRHLSELLEKYKNKNIAIIAYNAGMGNVDDWIDKGIINKDGSNLENVPYKETNMYLRKIIKNYEIYCKLY